ncbi:hypothetical protein NQZ79_g2525 [Umbelopsis isabellina]|nr:hypothetical protein NQZ79_g2525 [Umbelopsis isabellina]
MDRHPPYPGRGGYDDRYKGYPPRPRGDAHRPHDGYRDPMYRDRDGGRGYPPYMRSPPRRPGDSGRPYRDHSPPPPSMRSRYRSRSPPPPLPPYRSPPPYRERSYYPPPPSGYRPPYHPRSSSPYNRRQNSAGSVVGSSRPYPGPGPQTMIPSPDSEHPPFRGPQGPPPPPPPSHHSSRPNSPGPYGGPPLSPHPRSRVSIAPVQEKEIRRHEEEARKLQAEELVTIGTMRKKTQDLMLAAWEVDKAEHQLELVQRQWEEGNLDSILEQPLSLTI